MEKIIIQIFNYLIFTTSLTLLIVIFYKAIHFLFKIPGKDRIENKYKTVEQRKREKIKEKKDLKIIVVIGFIIESILYLLIANI